MTEFKTKRRPYGSGDNAWAPWYSLEYGYEDQSVGGRLVVRYPALLSRKLHS